MSTIQSPPVNLCVVFPFSATRKTFRTPMKWYKMDCDAQENLDMRKLVAEWGWDWYGRYYAIIGKIGMLVTETSQTFALQTNNGGPFPVRLLADDLSTNVERLTNFLNYLSDNHLIDPKAWKTKSLIYCPKLRKRADEYTLKLLKNRDIVGTKSRHSPEQEVDKKKNRIEEEKDIYQPILFQWNAFAGEAGLSQILKLSSKRKSGILARLAEPEFDLPKILEAIKNSEFLRGKNEQGWKVDFDWIFGSANNYLKILEGKYVNGRTPRKSEQVARATFKHTEADTDRFAKLKEALDERDRERNKCA